MMDLAGYKFITSNRIYEAIPSFPGPLILELYKLDVSDLSLFRPNYSILAPFLGLVSPGPYKFRC